VNGSVIYPSAYIWPEYGGWFNPYFGGFGHFNHPFAGAGYTWPASLSRSTSSLRPSIR
jgi:hypothetical protein